MRASRVPRPLLKLLVAVSLLSQASAEPPAADSALRDALSSAAPPPVRAADTPPTDAKSWALLLERARQAVQSESAASRRVDGVQVVRETFFVPLPKVGEPPASTPVQASAGATEETMRRDAKETSEPANILKTIGKLKALRPLWTYAIHHPLRFLYGYALVPLLHLVLSLLLAILSLLLSILALPLAPLTFLFTTLVLTPLATAYGLFTALAPLWWTLLGALVCGAACGLLAGLIAGRSTRAAIDETLAYGARAARWLGVVPKESTPAGRREFGPGAKLERFAPASVYTSSSGTSPRRSAKSRGKQRAYDDDSTGFETGTGTSAYGAGAIKREETPNDELEEEEYEEESESGEDPLARQEGLTIAGASGAGWRARKVPW